MTLLKAAYGHLLATWSLLVLAAGLARPLGETPATLTCFGAATALAVATRRGPRLDGRPLAAGLCLGVLSYPAWAFALSLAGRALGLQATAPAGARSVASGIALLLLAPLFEELLYRERLLAAFEVAAGRAFAVVATTLLFAVPHPDPWSRLAAAATGPALALLALRTGGPSASIGLHAGLNLGATAGVRMLA